MKSSSCSSLEEVGLKRGPWTPEEDRKLISYIQRHGHGTWSSLPPKAGLRRCGKSCRLRWTNYLRPDIKRGKFSLQEEQAILQLHALLGNKWSAIAAHLPKRTDNDIKNFWNTHLKKRLLAMGVDPTTHRPLNDAVNYSSNLSHMAQWETARLQAEARLAKQPKLQLGSSSPPPPTRLVLNRITPLAKPSPRPCLDVLQVWQNSLSPLSKPSSAPTTTHYKAPRMHSMYAMMLATDDDLDSPASTLSFPISSDVVMNDRKITYCGLGNKSLAAASSSSTTVVADNGVMKERRLGDDDIMAVVEEAFRSGGGRTEMEGLRNDDDDVMVENSEPDKMGIFSANEDGGSANSEEKNYWNSIVNDLL